MKHWDRAFFADSPSETLLCSEDPDDQPLLDSVPVILAERSFRCTSVPEKQAVMIRVVRDGHVRATVRAGRS